MSRAPRTRRDALAGDGPIVNRARVALRRTAEQFGAVVGADQTSVTVRTRDGIRLKLGYDPGNYVFSRVYNLRITTVLPEGTEVPPDLELSHRDRSGARFARKTGRRGPAGRGAGSGAGPAASAPAAAAPASTPRLDALNARVADHLRRIDLLKAEVAGPKSARELSLVPMGGSYVWVLIPPVFKATAFPAGEPDRILDLIRSMRAWHPVG